mgnify:CR=1 FL=1
MPVTRRGYVQIIPADGWWAIYKAEDGSTIKSKIAALALDEEGDIVWLDQESRGWCEDATESLNFVGVFYDGDPALDAAKR